MTDTKTPAPPGSCPTCGEPVRLPAGVWRKDPLSDGITLTSETLIVFPAEDELAAAAPIIRALDELLPGARSGDRYIAQLERSMREVLEERARILEDHAEPKPDPVYGTLEWYAPRILEAVERVRRAVRSQDAELAATEGMRLERLVAEVKAKQWPATRLGARVREKNRMAAQRPRGPRTSVHEADAVLKDAVSRHRERFPLDSERAMAKQLARELDRPAATIRRRLRELQRS